MTTSSNSSKERLRSLVKQASQSLLAHRRYPHVSLGGDDYDKELFIDSHTESVVEKEKLVKNFMCSLEGLEKDTLDLSNKIMEDSAKISKINGQIQRLQNNDWSVIDEWEKEEAYKLPNNTFSPNKNNLIITQKNLTYEKLHQWFYRNCIIDEERGTRILCGNSPYEEIEYIFTSFGINVNDMWLMAYKEKSRQITYYWGSSYWATFNAYKTYYKENAFDLYTEGIDEIEGLRNPEYEDTNNYSLFYTLPPLPKIKHRMSAVDNGQAK